MTLDHLTAGKAATPDSPGADAAAVSDRDGSSALIGREPEPRRGPNRTAIALGFLIALCVLALNVVIYRAVLDRAHRERWEQLAGFADERRGDVRAALERFTADAGYLATRPSLQAAGALNSVDTISPEMRARLDAEFSAASAAFGLQSLRLVTADGLPISGTTAGPSLDRARASGLIRATSSSGSVATAFVCAAGERHASVWAAAPIRAANGNTSSFLLVAANVDELLRLVSRPVTPRGAHVGSFLVTRDGNDIVVLSAPPPGLWLSVGDRLRENESRARAAAAAAAGHEATIEIPRREGGAVWAVTRAVPEAGVGIIGQADRVAVLIDARDPLAASLAFDLGLVLLALPTTWLVRRRSRAARAVREAERTHRQTDRLRSVFDHAFDAIMSFDAAGRLLSVNRAAEVLFGRPAEHIVGDPVHRILRLAPPGKPASIDPAALQNVTRSEALRLDGRIVPVEYSLACSGDGPDRVYTAVVRDISERMEAEARIRAFAQGLEVTNRRLEEANAQLEEASKLKSEFLANTSHELRTPLNGMIGFLQLVLDGMCDSREEERDFLQQALQCSRHLLGLINDVLDIAKIEAGKLSLDIEAVDARSLLGEVYTLTHVQAAQKGLTLKIESPEHPTHPLRGDFNKIKQILLNLVSNSLKFTSQGSITIRATEHAELGYYMFDVLDTGIGIPADRQRLIFEKFTQGDGSSTRKFGGTGLGLAISKSLVELMGGIIGVESEGPGTGTRMYFSLPVWRAEEDTLPPEDQRVSDRIEGPPGGPIILVVEDDGVFRKYLTALLRGHGYRTVEASHAEAGWMLARRLRPALVVLDYALSSAEGANLRTGWDLAERMTTDPNTRHIPLIFVTGFDLQLKEKLRNATFARRPEHLMKPVEGHALVAKIEEMVGASRDGVIRVLIADDDPSVAAYVRKVLPQERYHIEIANNGDECLHILRTQPSGFDLLLLDLMMPDVSGYDVLRELSLTRIHNDLPVLILTNFPEARNDDEKRLLEKGLVLDIIAKPSVHENPRLLSHIIDWHLQVAAELGHGASQHEVTPEPIPIAAAPAVATPEPDAREAA